MCSKVRIWSSRIISLQSEGVPDEDSNVHTLQHQTSTTGDDASGGDTGVNLYIVAGHEAMQL